MGAALAHMAAKGDDRVTATTFFAAQHDFAEAGDLLLFTDEHWLAQVEQQMDAAGGVLPGAAMAETFNALRANDLIWSFFVSNYLMGKSPPAFDLLFWNADQTRMPKTLHMDYLRSMYGQNRLAQGRVRDRRRQGRPVEGEDPALFPGQPRGPHRADELGLPLGPRLLERRRDPDPGGLGPHRRGGQSARRPTSTSTGSTPPCPPPSANGRRGAVEHPGSWWNHWADWLHDKSGDWIAARDPNKGPLAADRTGARVSYVKVKS